MGFLDLIKALGVALLLMALNVAIAFAVMWVFGNYIEPGHEPGFYQAAAQRIAPRSSLIAGLALFFLAGWEFARRKPERNGLLFAAAFSLIYIAADLAIIVAAGALSFLGLIVAASMGTKFVAAIAGAYFARPRAG